VIVVIVVIVFGYCSLKINKPMENWFKVINLVKAK